MHKRPIYLLAMAALQLIFSLSMASANDVETSLAEKAFRVCEGCHTMDGSTYQSIAPDLLKLENRIAGTNPGFNYSKSMRTAGEDGLVWDRQNLLQFLSKPRAMVRGTTMKFKGIANEAERENLVQWLLEASGRGVAD